MTALKFGERPRHLEDLEGDPSWRPRKPKPGPWVCGVCGGVHQYKGHDGRLYGCGHHCSKHREEKGK